MVERRKASLHEALSGDSRWFSMLILFFMFVAGLAIRLYDLTDPPFDFHPTRQFRCALIARGIYYQLSPNMDEKTRQTAIAYKASMGVYEPPLLETLVALTYLATGGERLWIARLYSALFWMIGGLGLYTLARRMSSAEGGLAALAFYLFLPFAVFASRSFQPDPWMVMWIVWAAYGFIRWSETQHWRWAGFTGVSAGMAVLVKAVAVYLVIGMAAAVVLSILGLCRALKNRQVWAMIALISLPTILYYGIGLQSRSLDYLSNWSIALAGMLLSPSFYMRWMNQLQNILGITPLFLGIAGMLISKSYHRALLLGLWMGYLVYGMSLPHQITTHNYYSLQLVPVVALSIAPIATLFLSRLKEEAFLWQMLFVLACIVLVVYFLRIAQSTLANQDFRKEPLFWQEVADALPKDGKAVALTQDYGYPLMYYGWRKVTLWSTLAEMRLAELRGKASREFHDEFERRTAGHRYFLITAMGQWSAQKALQDWLWMNYRLVAQGERYLIFDLGKPLSEP
jgi:uncharacterized membrane protein